jgi:glycosyltransferase involved in cell wall biosynthesis
MAAKSMSQPSISIAMCTFNGAKFLEEQLQSFVSQTVLPNELIICDDRSTDGSWEILEAFSRSAPFTVRLTANPERLGSAHNFEKAIGMCRGEVIALSDQDDVWLPRKLEILLKTLETDPGAAYVFSDAEIIQEEGAPLGLGLWEVKDFSPEQASNVFALGQFELLLRSNVVTGCTMAFRSSFRNMFLPVPRHWIHDHWIALVGSSIAHGVVVPDRLVRYRKHASQQIGANWATLSGRIKDSCRTRRQDYLERLSAAQELQERVQFLARSASIPRNYLDQVDDKTHHLAVRAAIYEASGITRLRLVLRESFSGRYGRFSSWLSIVRDLCPQFLLN